MNTTAPYATTVLIENYLGIQFNFSNEIFVTKDGAVCFTDPTDGYIQGIRLKPKLPPQVYRYETGMTNIRVVAYGLAQPNGLTFSPDEKIAYITDGTAGLTVRTNTRPIYAYDVRTIGNQPYLTNKCVFAIPQVGIPDGIKVDSKGERVCGLW